MNENSFELIIDGNEFNTYKEFTEYFSEKFLKQRWNGGLDAFEDILFQRFGLPYDNFKIKWINSKRSYEKLGVEETIKWYNERIKNCYPSNVKIMQDRLELLVIGKERTIFEMLINIIKEQESEGDLTLILE